MKKTSLTLALCALMSSPIMAGTMGPVYSGWTAVASLAAGPAWNEEGDSRTLFLTPTIEKTYTYTDNSNVLGAGELFLGAQKQINDRFFAQLGLDLGVAGDTVFAGEIWDDADPTFNNHVYKYHVTHYQVGLKGKLLAEMGYWVMPWVSGSVNAGFNRSYDFKNAPVIFEALPNPNYRSKYKTAFSYTVGAGVQKQWNQHWQVGAGYEFADWGVNRLGRAPGQTVGKGLGQNHVYTHGLMINLTYLA